MTKYYVLGIAFNLTRSRVLLQARTYPAWQKGLYNGIGGHVEPNEGSFAAMEREAREETNLYKIQPGLQWRHFATVFGKDYRFRMECYTTDIPGLELAKAPEHEERVRVVDVRLALHVLPTIGNIPTLICLARDRYLAEPVTITELDRTNWRDEELEHLQKGMNALRTKESANVR